jgi:ribosomal protein S18 acetylase RimI-like enzyme
VYKFLKAATSDDFTGILRLQKANLATNLSQIEKATQGFLFVTHTDAQLREFNEVAPHIVVHYKSEIVGYVLSMPKIFRQAIPVLIPLFEMLDTIRYNEKNLNQHHYLMIGQVAIDKNNRGKKLFQQAYQFFRQQYQPNYAFALTEIATNNYRSLHVHQKLGFEIIHTYTDPQGLEWAIVIWDWSKSTPEVGEMD